MLAQLYFGSTAGSGAGGSSSDDVDVCCLALDGFILSSAWNSLELSVLDKVGPPEWLTQTQTLRLSLSHLRVGFAIRFTNKCSVSDSFGFG